MKYSKTEHCNIKDIKLSQQFGYIITYYKVHIVIGFLFLSAVFYVVYVSFFRPHTDVTFVLLTDAYGLDTRKVFEEKTSGTFDWDFNGDGVVKTNLLCIEFNNDYSKLSDASQSQIAALFATGESYIWIVNDRAFEWLDGQMDVLADENFTGESSSTAFRADIENIPFFRKADIPYVKNGLSLCLLIPPDDEDVKNLKRYNFSVHCLEDILSY